MNVYLNKLKNYLFLCDKEEKTKNFCIIGNKFDLEHENKIGNNFIQKMTNNYGIQFFDISVKSLRNINNLIQFFVKIYDKLAFHEKWNKFLNNVFAIIKYYIYKDIKNAHILIELSKFCKK